MNLSSIPTNWNIVFFKLKNGVLDRPSVVVLLPVVKRLFWHLGIALKAAVVVEW